MMWLSVGLAVGGILAAIGAWAEQRDVEDLSWDDYWRHV